MVAVRAVASSARAALAAVRGGRNRGRVMVRVLSTGVGRTRSVRVPARPGGFRRGPGLFATCRNPWCANDLSDCVVLGATQSGSSCIEHMFDTRGNVGDRCDTANPAPTGHRRRSPTGTPMPGRSRASVRPQTRRTPLLRRQRAACAFARPGHAGHAPRSSPGCGSGPRHPRPAADPGVRSYGPNGSVDAVRGAPEPCTAPTGPAPPP